MNYEESDEAKIRKIIDDYSRLPPDLDLFFSHREKDAISIPQGWKTMNNKEARVAYYKWVISGSVSHLEPAIIEEIMISEDLAFARVTFTSQFTLEDGTRLDPTYGRHLYVLRKNENGNWLIYRDIWNHMPYNDDE